MHDRPVAGATPMRGDLLGPLERRCSSSRRSGTTRRGLRLASLPEAGSCRINKPSTSDRESISPTPRGRTRLPRAGTNSSIGLPYALDTTSSRGGGEACMSAMNDNSSCGRGNRRNKPIRKAWPEICTPCASGSSRPPSQCSNSTLGTDAIRSCAEPSRHKAWMFLLTGFLRHPGCATAPAPRGQPENATTCRRPPRPLGPGVLRRAVDPVTTAVTFDLDHFRARVLQDCLTCFKR
jgi:hypothetical protein